MLEIKFWVWSSAGSVGLKFSGPSAKLLITLIIFNFFRSDPLSSTYFDSRFNSPKENRYRPFETKLQKPPSCIPQWISIVSSRTQTFNLKENAQHSFTCSFLKRLPLTILRLFQCFYHFLVLHKKKIMYFSESDTFTRPEDWWERKLFVVRFFYLFWTSGRP